MARSLSLYCGRCAIVLAALAALPVFVSGARPIRIKGTVKRGESFRHKAGDGLMFGLDPTSGSDCQGWQVWVGPSEQAKTYASIATTPRRHGLIETDICGSDFRKNVNRPQEIRQFRFVATRSDYQVLEKAYEALDRNAMTAEQLSSEISRHGHVRTGTLKITGLAFGVGSQPIIERLDFTVELD